MPDLTDYQRRVLVHSICTTLAHDLPCVDCGVAVESVEAFLAACLDHAEETGFLRGFEAGVRSEHSVPEEVGGL